MRAHRYRITICGGLAAVCRDAFADFDIELEGTNTVLCGELDQAALHGVLDRIQALGLELAEVRRLAGPRTDD